MLYLFGTNHNGQHRGAYHDPANARDLDKVVRRVCQEYGVTVLAEEYSEEACLCDGVSGSICHDLAVELGIDHVYCDPTSEERMEAGMPSIKKIRDQVRARLNIKYLIGFEACRAVDEENAKHFAKRENVWLSRITQFRSRDVLFVCGSAHVDSFRSVLEANGWRVETV